MCPHCRQDAPIVYRGVVPYCTACGKIRAPLTERSVTLAGRPKAVGGTVSFVLGWIVLGVGLALALGVGLLVGMFAPTAGIAVGSMLGIIFLTIGLVMVLGGRSLRRSGAADQRDVRTAAVFALAAHRGGILTALDVARASNIREDEADALLTHLAKTVPDRCTLEVDEHGAIFFRFANAPWDSDPRFRVGVDAPRSRVAEPHMEQPQVIDAELVDEPPARTRSAR
jgi:hypothetical protein